jgi:hypothetical protein
LLALAACLGLAGAGVARAQNNDDLVVEDGNVAAADGGVMPQQFNLDQVDNMVFNRMGGSAGARARFDAALALRIDDLDRSCNLTEAQKKKLKLAGRGDIKRVFDRVDEVKRSYRQNPLAPNNNIWQAIQPLQLDLNAGVFNDDSLFAKTIRNTLTDDQAARFDSLTRERKLGRYRATVEWFVMEVGKLLGFNHDQRRRFAELIVNDTVPPLRFGQSDFWYLMLQVSKLPEAKVKPIFDDEQWRLLSRHFAQARGMEQWLRTSRVLGDAKREGADAGAAPRPIRGGPAIYGAPLR